MDAGGNAGGNASDQAAHRLRPEERMLLFIMYVRSLHIGHIVKYIMSEPLPVRRGTIQESDHLTAMHAHRFDHPPG